MARDLKFRPSLADTRRANKAAHEYYAAISGKETPPEQAILHADVREKVARGPRKPAVEGDGSEASNLKEIIKFLCNHRLVAIVERHNSGMAYNANGAPVVFHTIYTRGVNGERLKKSDITGMLITGRYFAIEVKNSSWTKPTDEREYQQENYLAHVRRFGGIGIFATCVEDVGAVL